MWSTTIGFANFEDGCQFALVYVEVEDFKNDYVPIWNQTSLRYPHQTRIPVVTAHNPANP
jgi:hypothetical protein